MKRGMLLMLISGLLMAVSPACAQSVAKKQQKEARKQLTKKQLKICRKEAKRLKKEGWINVPGTLPLEHQLCDAFEKDYLKDENGMPLYISAEGNGVGRTYSGAQAQAIQKAKVVLAQQIESYIVGLVKESEANRQIDMKTAETITEVLRASRDLIAQRLGTIEVVVRMMRYLPDDHVEVQVRVFYNLKRAFDIVRQQIREELKNKLQKTEEEVEQIFNQIWQNATQ